jgi:DNA-binding HxlR family transcriptional regulator
MPRTAWNGYRRFCPLARALDVIGDRWTLVIVQELLKRSSRYNDLARRLPGVGTTVLAERLRKLEVAGVVERRARGIGKGVEYALTERGVALSDALAALRQWGVNYLTDPTADGAGSHAFDVHYVDGIDALDDVEFGLVVDDNPTTLQFARGHLVHVPGSVEQPELTIHTSSSFMQRWAAGSASWDDGLQEGDVVLTGSAAAWPRWLAATGYLLAFEPEADHGSPDDEYAPLLT